MQSALNIIANYRAPHLALELDPLTRFDEWVDHGRRLCFGSRALNWHIGDWWNFGVSRWGEVEARKAATSIWGVEGETARVYGWVAEKFEPVTRVTGLSFRHYQEAASIPFAEALELLGRAERERLSTRDLRREVQARKVANDGPALPPEPSATQRFISEHSDIAERIEEEAKRIGRALPDFLAMLISRGWKAYQEDRANDRG